MLKGNLICLAGLDGSGKTTQLTFLENWLKKYNLQVEAFSLYHLEIKKNQNYRKCIDFMKENKIGMTSDELTIIYRAFEMSDRLQNIIIPSLSEGKTIITDRYIETFDCRSYLANIDTYWAYKIIKSIPEPFVSIFIDTSPEVCKERIIQRNLPRSEAESRNNLFREYERVSNLTKAREFYLSNQAKYKFNIVDGNLDKEAVFQNIIGIIKNYL